MKMSSDSTKKFWKALRCWPKVGEFGAGVAMVLFLGGCVSGPVYQPPVVVKAPAKKVRVASEFPPMPAEPIDFLNWMRPAPDEFSIVVVPAPDSFIKLAWSYPELLLSDDTRFWLWRSSTVDGTYTRFLKTPAPILEIQIRVEPGMHFFKITASNSFGESGFGTTAKQ